MRWWPGMSVNIKYTVALICALHVSVRKKTTCYLHDFLGILHETEWPLVLQMSTAITIHQLSPSDRLIFRNSLFGAGILEKNEYVSQHTYACVNVHNPRTISWIAAFGQY